jgi:hypothetical protein
MADPYKPKTMWELMQINPYRKRRTYLPGTQSPGPAYEYHNAPPISPGVETEANVIKGTARKSQPGTDWGGIDLQTGEQTGTSRSRVSKDRLDRYGADTSNYPGGGRSVWEVPFHDPKDRFDYYANLERAGGAGGFYSRREDYVVGGPAKPVTQASLKKGPTAEERAEAWKQAMADAQGFMGPMQGGTIPGVAPGGGSREHQMSVYNTGGYDLTSNRPIADTDAVRKRLYGIMGFGR